MYERMIEEMRYYDDLDRYFTKHTGEMYDFDKEPEPSDIWDGGEDTVVA